MALWCSMLLARVDRRCTQPTVRARPVTAQLTLTMGERGSDGGARGCNGIFEEEEEEEEEEVVEEEDPFAGDGWWRLRRRLGQGPPDMAAVESRTNRSATVRGTNRRDETDETDGRDARDARPQGGAADGRSVGGGGVSAGRIRGGRSAAFSLRLDYQVTACNGVTI